MAALSVSILSLVAINTIGTSKIEIKGNTFFSNEYLLNLYKPAKDYSEIEIFIKKILDMYCNAGFPFCSIYPELVNTESVREKLVLNIVEGERIVIRDYLFKTNGKTEINPLRSIARIKKDRYFSQQELKKIKRSISKTNAFSDITEKILKKGDDYYVLLEIKEKSTDYINSTGALTQYEKYLSFDFFSLNLFGTLRQFGFNYELNNLERYNKRGLNIKFTEPVFLCPVIFNIGLQILSYDSVRFVELKVNFNTPLNEYLNTIITSGIEMTSYLTDTGSYHYEHTSLGTGLEWNFRNNYMHIRFDYLIRNNDRIRFFYDGKIIYTNLFIKPHYRYVKTKSFEYFDYIKVGGAKSLRGYMEDRFLVKQAFWLNVEYKVLPVFPLIDIAYLDKNFTYSYGVGIDVKTNLVNASVIWAIPEKGTWNDGKIHLLLEKEL